MIYHPWMFPKQPSCFNDNQTESDANSESVTKTASTLIYTQPIRNKRGRALIPPHQQLAHTFVKSQSEPLIQQLQQYPDSQSDSARATIPEQGPPPCLSEDDGRVRGHLEVAVSLLDAVLLLSVH